MPIGTIGSGCLVLVVMNLPSGTQGPLVEKLATMEIVMMVGSLRPKVLNRLEVSGVQPGTHWPSPATRGLVCGVELVEEWKE